ncbi:MAG: hypothetical protein Q9169_004058 [Polycauliona sp. 2 TL-2023]
MIPFAAIIRPLPDDVAAQIKSSTTISSLEHVVIELFKNSLDAFSHRIDINIDFSRGSCTVEDDGLGIKPAEFLDTGGLGKAYPTLIYHHTRPAARLVPAPSRYQLTNREHGTKVDVHDLFGNMPVRVKQRGLTSTYEKEHRRQWETIRRYIVGSLLAWHYPITVTLRGPFADRDIVLRDKTVEPIQKTGDDGVSKSFDLVFLNSVLSQAGYIEPHIRETWVKTSARTPFMIVRGAFSLQPAPSKKTQFLSLGIRYLGPDTGASIFYEEINRIFALSSFGDSDHVSDDEITMKKKSMDGRYKQDGPTNKQLRGTGKSVDRWPMFVIRIEMEEHVSSGGLGERDILERESTLASIIKVVGAMTTAFLNDHHFRPRTRQHRRRPVSSQHTDSVLGQVRSGGKASASPSSVATPNRRPWSSPHTREQTKSTTFGDDTLSSSIQLPKVRLDRAHYTEAFSGWSRIKSGATRGISDDCLDVKSNVRPSQTRHHEDPSEQSPAEALQGGPAELVTENTFTWINPVTNAPCLLDSRTGQSVPHLSKRTAASENDTTYDEGALHSVSHTTGIARLPRCASTSVAPKADSWVSSLLKAWDNPVFSPATEQAIPQVSFKEPILEAPNALNGSHRGCSHRDIERAFSGASTTLCSARLSKSGLLNARIISQVDKKFILVLMEHLPPDGHSPNKTADEHQILTLIDQHAADERVRIEALLQEFCTPPSPETSRLEPSPGVATTLLPKPIAFPIKVQERRLFNAHAHHFARWGILYQLSKSPKTACSPLDTTTCITVRSLPPAIAERCRLEPKLLIELLRKEIWKREEDGRSTRPSPSSPKTPNSDTSNTKPLTWLTQLTTCPQGIIDMLNSRACRSAIMFNDELNHAECETLVARLAECKFPFQCAHGRPSMVPLVAVGQNCGEGLGAWAEGKETANFADAWKAWRGGSEVVT